MKAKLLNLCVVFTSLVAYLEWGKDSRMLLALAEWEVLSKLFADPASVMHPLIIIPLLGQVVLVCTLFQKMPGRRLTLGGLSCIGILMLMILVTGLLSMNYKIVLSVVPFLGAAYVVVRNRPAYA